MNNDDFYLQGTDSVKESFNFPELVEFEWNIIYSCNYRCSYCFFNGKWEEYGKRNRILSVSEWLKCWQRIYDNYNRCAILVTGGEPFIYPDFHELIKELAKIHYPINISTNSSGNIESFAGVLKEIDVISNKDNKRVSVTLSFHPEYDSLDKVLQKNAILKSYGLDAEFINLVAYPPFLENIDILVKKALTAGDKLKVIPFIGCYEGRQYPDSYDAGEKQVLGIDEKWMENTSKKGKICYAGKKSALIFPDGKVVRCGQIGERFIIGNIFSEDFSLLDKPLGCDVGSCPCLEDPDK